MILYQVFIDNISEQSSKIVVEVEKVIIGERVKFYLTMIQVMGCIDSKKSIQFIPQKWQQGIGEVCQFCKTRLISQSCISLCKCFLFCHEQCFLKQFAQYIEQKQQIKCIRCGEQVVLQLMFVSKCECNKKPINLILIGFFFVVLLAVMILTIQKVFDDDYGWPIFAVGVVVFLIVLACTQRRKELLLNKIHVKSTNLLGSLQTGQQIVRNSNKYINDLQNLKCDAISGTSSQKVQYDIQ